MILSLPPVENIGNFKLKSLDSEFFLTEGTYLFNNLNFYSNQQSKELNFDLVATENTTIKKSANFSIQNFSSIDKSWNIVLVDVNRCANYRNKLKSSE